MPTDAAIATQPTIDFERLRAAGAAYFMGVHTLNRTGLEVKPEVLKDPQAYYDAMFGKGNKQAFDSYTIGHDTIAPDFLTEESYTALKNRFANSGFIALSGQAHQATETLNGLAFAPRDKDGTLARCEDKAALFQAFVSLCAAKEVVDNMDPEMLPVPYDAFQATQDSFSYPLYQMVITLVEQEKMMEPAGGWMLLDGQPLTAIVAGERPEGYDDRRTPELQRTYAVIKYEEVCKDTNVVFPKPLNFKALIKESAFKDEYQEAAKKAFGEGSAEVSEKLPGFVPGDLSLETRESITPQKQAGLQGVLVQMSEVIGTANGRNLEDTLFFNAEFIRRAPASPQAIAEVVTINSSLTAEILQRRQPLMDDLSFAKLRETMERGLELVVTEAAEALGTDIPAKLTQLDEPSNKVYVELLDALQKVRVAEEETR